MCREGVNAFVQNLQAHDFREWASQHHWASIRDGFGTRKQEPTVLCTATCGICNKSFPIVKRVLESSAYNLPDAVVYQRLRLSSPGVALGQVVKGRTTSPDKYAPSEHVRQRWQGLMWSVYQVAFVDVCGDAVGPFYPTENWGIGAPPTNLDEIAADARAALHLARHAGSIPVGTDSRATEDQVGDVLAPIMFDRYGYKALKSWNQKKNKYVYVRKSVPAFWWGTGHQLDLLYQNEGEQSSIAIEVKVTEDWDHPICEPLGDLIGHNAVLNIRVPTQEDQLDKATRQLVTKAETMLEATGRAKFMCIWP